MDEQTAIRADRRMGRKQGDADVRPFLKSRRRPPGGVRTKAKSLTIPVDVLERLEAAAASPKAQGKSESWIAGDAISEYLEREFPPNP